MLKRASHRFARWRALAPAQRRTLVAACLAMPLFWIGLHTAGLKRVRAFVEGAPLHTAPQTPPPETRARALGELVNLAARRGPFPASCLTRSLVLQWLLRRHGIAAQLRIGVRRLQGPLDAHAWVEYGGVPVNDRADVANDYAVFGQLPPAAARRRP
ncbi:MAG: lasso peptide biosynthesis B2 protein [Pseudomonadota bacterium]